MNMRLIPVLLLQNNRLVKGQKFTNHQYVGDPINSVKLFNEYETDELCIIDINARNNGFIDFEYLELLASECFMPLTYIGGIKDIVSVKRLFKIGIEKIGVNTLALEREDLIQEMVNIFGGQSIVISLDIVKK